MILNHYLPGHFFSAEGVVTRNPLKGSLISHLVIEYPMPYSLIVSMA